jgi:hypothetical protein
MINLIIDNIKRAWDKIKAWSSLISERVRIELGIVRLLNDSRKIDSKIAHLYQKIGKRIFELKEREDIWRSNSRNIFKDEEISTSFAEIQRLLQEKELILKKVSEIFAGEREE